MILVTVGTTMPFDELIQEVDRLCGQGIFHTEVICQHGQSSYRPKNCAYFMAAPTLNELLDKSDFVVTHGGMTVVQLLMMKKNFIAFANPRSAGNHQAIFLQNISAVSDISWSCDVGDLHSLFLERERAGAPRLSASYPRASKIVDSLVGSRRPRAVAAG